MVACLKTRVTIRAEMRIITSSKIRSNIIPICISPTCKKMCTNVTPTATGINLIKTAIWINTIVNRKMCTSIIIVPRTCTNTTTTPKMYKVITNNTIWATNLTRSRIYTQTCPRRSRSCTLSSPTCPPKWSRRSPNRTWQRIFRVETGQRTRAGSQTDLPTVGPRTMWKTCWNKTGRPARNCYRKANRITTTALKRGLTIAAALRRTTITAPQNKVTYTTAAPPKTIATAHPSKITTTTVRLSKWTSTAANTSTANITTVNRSKTTVKWAGRSSTTANWAGKSRAT